MKFVAAHTTDPDVHTAAQELHARIQAGLQGGAPDLAVFFLSIHHGPNASDFAAEIETLLSPRHLLGCTAEAVIGRDREIEGEPAAVLLAGELPEVDILPFRLGLEEGGLLLENPTLFRASIGLDGNPALFLFLGDPFTLPVDRVLRAFNDHYPGVPVVGGMASVAPQMGGNTLLLDGERPRRGGVGLALSGNLAADVVVSQGCRPVGPVLRVTRSDRNAILELDGDPALEVVRGLLEEFPDEDKPLLNLGLFMGVAIEAGREEYGRGDFLVRNILGYNPEISAVVVGDMIDEGALVQLHLRDGTTALEDLEMMLLPQSLLDPPRGGLVFSCNGRGTRLYGRPDADITAIQGSLGNVPCAGFFCAGELGPIGGVNFIHGHTASVVLFRPKQDLAPA